VIIINFVLSLPLRKEREINNNKCMEKKLLPIYSEIYSYRKRIDVIIKKIEKQNGLTREDIENLSKLGANILFDSRWAYLIN
jgi:hypothetical protein